MRKRIVTTALCALLMTVPAPEARAQFGGATWCTNCSTEWTQALVHAQQLMQYVKEAQTALQAVQMAQLMARAGVNLIQHPSPNIAQDIGQFTSILAASQGIARNMATLDTDFQMQYGSYTPSPVLTFANQYNNWATATMKTLSGSLGAAGYQGQSLVNDQLLLARIQMQAQTPQGEVEALQLGNSIGTATVAQLMNLRALMIADMSSKAAIAGQQTQAQQQTVTTQQNAFAFTPPQADQRVW